MTFLREYKKYAIIAPILVVVEVFFDVYIPRVMSMIIDKGINGENGADLGYVFKMGGVMIAMSMAARTPAHIPCGAIASMLGPSPPSSRGCISSTSLSNFS